MKIYEIYIKKRTNIISIDKILVCVKPKGLDIFLNFPENQMLVVGVDSRGSANVAFQYSIERHRRSYVMYTTIVGHFTYFILQTI
jgi:hypothetical protein